MRDVFQCTEPGCTFQACIPDAPGDAMRCPLCEGMAILLDPARPAYKCGGCARVFRNSGSRRSSEKCPGCGRDTPRVGPTGKEAGPVKTPAPAEKVRFACGECGKRLVVAAAAAGKSCTCVACGTRQTIPAASQPGPAAAPRPSGFQAVLTGSAARTARDLVGVNLDPQVLILDGGLREQMMKVSLLLAATAADVLRKAKHAEAARAVEETQAGLVILVGGWNQFAAGCQGLQLTYLQLTMVGYFGILQHAVRTFGLGEMGQLESFDGREMADNVLKICDPMRQILKQVQEQQRKKRGLLGWLRGWFKRS